MAAPLNLPKDAVPVYSVDPAKSRFQVKAAVSGLLSAFGHNPVIAVRSFTGEARFRLEAPEESALLIEIDATSLVIAGDANEKDRGEMDRVMKEDVLEIDRYPVIRFAGSGTQAVKIMEGMYRVSLAGKLSLHGVEKNVEFPCNVFAAVDNLRANGEFSIRQTDYRIKLVSVAGGALKLKDELKFAFDIVAHRKREAANA